MAFFMRFCCKEAVCYARLCKSKCFFSVSPAGKSTVLYRQKQEAFLGILVEIDHRKEHDHTIEKPFSSVG